MTSEIVISIIFILLAIFSPMIYSKAIADSKLKNQKDEDEK